MSTRKLLILINPGKVEDVADCGKCQFLKPRPDVKDVMGETHDCLAFTDRVGPHPVEVDKKGKKKRHYECLMAELRYKNRNG